MEEARGKVGRALENVRVLIKDDREAWRDQWRSSVLYQTRDLLEEAMLELRPAGEGSGEAGEEK